MPTTTDRSLYRLMTWLSPSYPVGAYAFSHGLEHAVESGRVGDRDSACEWIRDLVQHGTGRADLVFLREAWEAGGDTAELCALSSYALAFQPTSELRTESIAQGKAFADVSRAAWATPGLTSTLDAVGDTPSYPVVVGAVAHAHNVHKEAAMVAYVHAFVSNLVSAAVRLVPLGQTDGQRVIAGLEADIDAAVTDAGTLTRYTVSTATIMSDISSMKHETQYTRLFRS